MKFFYKIVFSVINFAFPHWQYFHVWICGILTVQGGTSELCFRKLFLPQVKTHWYKRGNLEKG